MKPTAGVRITSLVALAGAFICVPLGDPASAAAISVTTRNDELNNDGDCSLREAIVTVNEGTAQSGCANPSAGGDTIKLGSGSYGLTRTGTGEFESKTGSLDLRDPGTVIIGKGMRRTVIDANGIDRVFWTLAKARFAHLQITGGDAGADAGGGILAAGPGPVTLDHVLVTKNKSTGTSLADSGGGIASTGRMTIVDSEISKNEAPYGGGIFQGSGASAKEPGILTMRRSMLHQNQSSQEDSGAGLQNFGEATLENVTVSDNLAGGLNAAGIYGTIGSVELIHSTVAFNDPYNIRLKEHTSLTLENSIVGPPNVANCIVTEPVAIVLVGNNIDQDGTCQAEGTMQVDPELKPLGQYGGPVPTHALQPSSPAINESAEGGCVKTDARGAPRPRSGCSSPDDNVQDLGAYELVRCSGIIVDEVGTPGRDRLVGSPQPNGILALDGNDKVLGRGGSDKACGGGGADVLKGQDGGDRLLGQAGNDSLDGGPGSDTCIGGPGTDKANACEKKRSL